MKSIRASSLLFGASLATFSEALSFPEVIGIPEWQVQRSLGPDRVLQQVVGFADPAVCYPALEVADANVDRLVDDEEYVDYVKAMGPDGFLDGITTFDELPLQLKSNFNVLVCLCQTDPDDESCCVGDDVGILTNGAYEGEIPSPEQESYLFIVCSLTAAAIERILSSVPPSASPSVAPSSLPTPAPSAFPTVAPSAFPTDAPSAFPTVAPSAFPSFSPSDSPTAAPVTPRPTVTPGTPTDSPSASPTNMPTTAEPTPAPTTPAPVTDAPTPGPTTAEPTPGPTTAQPTLGPEPTEAPAPVEESVSTVYTIGVGNGAVRTTYEPQLVDAMDSLTPEVLASVLDSMRRRLRLERRKLQSVSFPTAIDDITVVECPSGIPEEDVCEAVTASITLIFQPEQAGDSDEISETFVLELEAAIARGELMDALDLEWPGGDVYIIDNTLGTVPDGGGDDRSISGGGITGIVIGSLAAVLVLGFFAVRRSPPPKEELEELEPAPKDVEEDIAVEVDSYDQEFGATLGAVSPDYGKGHDAMMDNDDAIGSMSLADSSNAGSSGWSSSAGVSSLDTGSNDGLSAGGPISAFGSTLASLGLKTAQEPKPPASPEGSAVKSAPTVTRADLDSAIESGDWAAVGATAALLAAASDSQSHSSQSGAVSGTVSRSEDSSSLDAARAAELDHLVESGDWEGVVLAAAKYEAAETATSGSDSRAMDTSSNTSTPSKAKRRQELRSEVEDMVRRVVPEEIQNVDEMMQQFRGREEELIETLRTMEERAVAQKARQGAQKQAKVQAKQKTPEEREADASALLATIGSLESQDSGAAGGSFDDESPALASRSLGTGQVTSSTKSLGTGQVEGTSNGKSLGAGTMEGTPKRDRKQTALEEAIEKGDWEAVGQAAAMLSDHSLASSVETDELNRLADGMSSGGSDVGSSRGNLSDQAEELEDLIERGDWTGVVKAAASKTDKKEIEAKGKAAEEEARRQRRLKHIKGEEDALAEAEVWEAIAKQTKQEAEQSSTDQAASAAADWAIGRSLAALVQAEQGEGLTREDSSKAETQTDDDEEEV